MQQDMYPTFDVHVDFSVLVQYDVGRCKCPDGHVCIWCLGLVPVKILWPSEMAAGISVAEMKKNQPMSRHPMLKDAIFGSVDITPQSRTN